MSRRTAVLALCLLCLSSLAAVAASEPPQAPTPAVAGSVAVTNAPAADLSWLLQPAGTSQEPAANTLFGATPAFTCTTCICLCVQQGNDSICCRYLCHPIGMNPC
ncbi:MAG TPA: hypothetical protein VF173_07710 [Thermoanaerobaculia bacterium]|nr:hypothetical protein [Thermoanaerobaculia bacterium]